MASLSIVLTLEREKDWNVSVTFTSVNPACGRPVLSHYLNESTPHCQKYPHWLTKIQHLMEKVIKLPVTCFVA